MKDAKEKTNQKAKSLKRLVTAAFAVCLLSFSSGIVTKGQEQPGQCGPDCPMPHERRYPLSGEGRPYRGHSPIEPEFAPIDPYSFGPLDKRNFPSLDTLPPIPVVQDDLDRDIEEQFMEPRKVGELFEPTRPPKSNEDRTRPDFSKPLDPKFGAQKLPPHKPHRMYRGRFD